MNGDILPKKGGGIRRPSIAAISTADVLLRDILPVLHGPILSSAIRKRIRVYP
jgi:hypothetical protein